MPNKKVPKKQEKKVFASYTVFDHPPTFPSNMFQEMVDWTMPEKK